MMLLKNHIASLKCAIISDFYLLGKFIYWKCDECKHEDISITNWVQKEALKAYFKQNI